MCVAYLRHSKSEYGVLYSFSIDQSIKQLTLDPIFITVFALIHSLKLQQYSKDVDKSIIHPTRRSSSSTCPLSGSSRPNLASMMVNFSSTSMKLRHHLSEAFDRPLEPSRELETQHEILWRSRRYSAAKSSPRTPRRTFPHHFISMNEAVNAAFRWGYQFVIRSP
jgi:hypothetical protein